VSRLPWGRKDALARATQPARGADGRRFGIHFDRPRALAVLTWLYLMWSLVPILLAIRASFASGDAIDSGGFSLDPYDALFRHSGVQRVLVQSLGLAAATMAIATPLGAALALALRYRRRRSSSFMTGVLLMAVAVPQPVLAIALFFVFVHLFTFVRLDTGAELIAHVTLALPFVAVVTSLGLRSIGPEYEEMAMDLGASPTQSLRRVVLPLLAPSVVGAAVIAFVLSFDNLVLSDWLCFPESCRTIPLRLFAGAVDHNLGPNTYALGVTGLVLTSLAMAVGLWVVRVMRRARRA
jgi:spermidine/putrescine transport system permease protein